MEGAQYCLPMHITHSLHSSGGGGVTSVYYVDIVGLPKSPEEYQVNQLVLYMQGATALIVMHQDEMQVHHLSTTSDCTSCSNGAQTDFEPEPALMCSC